MWRETMQHTNQQKGSVMTFTVVGIVLVVAALGLLYSTRSQHNNAVVPAEEGVQAPVAQQSADDAKQDQKPEKEAAKPSQDAPQSGQRQEQPAQTEQRNAAGNSTPQAHNTPRATSTAPANSNLPTTGPADNVISLLASGVMTGAAVAYVRSRKLI